MKECKYCGKIFPIMGELGQGRKRKKTYLRKRGSVTCSPKCSRKYHALRGSPRLIELSKLTGIQVIRR